MGETSQDEAPGAPSSGSLAPSLSLPKGGGAIRGIGETFSTSAATGTGSLNIPIAISPGRAGFELSLSLSYDSGAGNGPFGVGWRLSPPAITRKTEKGLPRYIDGDESDVFVISGAEDLVPVRRASGLRDAFDAGDFHIERFRPRTEGLFARIERWTHRTTGDVHWRVTSRENVLNIYGRSTDARIADPQHEDERVFSWLLEETHDDRGNVARYTYKAEDAAGIDRGRPSESQRFITLPDGTVAFLGTAQRYLKRVQYGNKQPIADRTLPAPTSPDAYLFEVVFDYGEHDDDQPTPDEVRAWDLRPDPFSSYRATFEVRTNRLCRRVLMFHRIGELGDTSCLVRSTDFAYEHARVRAKHGSFEQGPVSTYLMSVTHAGYRRAADGAPYERSQMPPVELGYVHPEIDDTMRVLEPGSLDGIGSGVGSAGTQWVDLDGEGLPGVLISTERAWYYKRNLGAGRLAPPSVERTLPAPAELRGGMQQLADVGSDGNLDLVSYGRPNAGYFERTPERTWRSFVPLPNVPNINWNDPNLRFVDVDGDGFPDVLITEDDVLVWYRSRGKDGFEPATFAAKPRDEGAGPAVVFADGTETIQLADMSGDGLVDIVRVRNGEVCYWPNLGYGCFGLKVTLDNSPELDAPDQFDPRRVRLADIDGSGTTDLIYLARDGVRLYFNLSGNALSAACLLETLPAVDTQASVAVVDLLGTGTACLVWSSPLPGAAIRPLVYVDLMAGKKPHLLDRVTNNLGAETRIAYAPSTKFYLQDNLAGRPWLTRLAFPVQVVERVERHDLVSGAQLVSRFAYHHGYFDGTEREFRGFACVEQWDAETFDGGTNVPPVRTVTWFHTGAWLDREHLELELVKEYYGADPQEPLLPDTVLPAGLSLQEEREAVRALRGQILRQEIYAEDGTDQARHPYTVSERNYEIERLQGIAGEKNAVFFVHARHTITSQYERTRDDPRVGHEVVLSVDRFGNVTKVATIAYPRRTPRESEQSRTWITLTEHTFAHLDTEAAGYRVSVPTETIAYELTGLAAPADRVYSIAELQAAITAAGTALPYEASAGTGPAKRVVEHQRRFFYRDHATADGYWLDAGGALPLGDFTLRALEHHTERLALTPGLVASVYGSDVTDDMLRDEGRYVQRDGAWWISSGRTVRDPAAFWVTVGAIDGFGAKQLVRHDEYRLLVAETEDALGNRVTARNDYRTLGPSLLTDPNGNASEVELDALGMVVKVWKRNRDGSQGDDPGNPGAEFRYDLDAWRARRQPVFAHAAVREQHRSGGSAFAGDGTPRTSGFQHARTYSDGFGREAMKKVLAEPGPVPRRAAAGGLVRGPDGLPEMDEADVRWVGTGRTVFDNKGNRIKQYEPFFSGTLEFEDERELVEWGVTPVLHYDPLGRLVRTDHPNGTYTRVVFDAWRRETWDENDSVLDSTWYARWHDAPTSTASLLAFVRGFVPSWTTADVATDLHCAAELCRILGLAPPTQADVDSLAAAPSAVWGDVLARLADARRAARLTATHASTPAVAHLDALGRAFLTIAANGVDEDGDPVEYPTRVEYDIEGNQLAMIDARNSQSSLTPKPKALQQVHDVAGRRLRAVSQDAGETRTLVDIANKPIRTWDPRGFVIERRYDDLQRPTHLYATKDGARSLVERTVYGERHAAPEARNLRTRVYQAYDGAGVVTNDRFDFKGNPETTVRRLARAYQDRPDWAPLAGNLTPADIVVAAEPLLEPESFTTTATFDALGRVVSRTTPDQSTTFPSYNAAGFLETTRARIQGSDTGFVEDIDYNARGQREQIEYANGISTTYVYDPQTFRLVRQVTTDGNGRTLQHLTYTADPVGNVVAIRDAVSYGNANVSADALYEYDPVYHLVVAEAREHQGQQPMDADERGIGFPPQAHPNDWQALQRYRELYRYDVVGNIREMAHDRLQPLGGSVREWTRAYEYAAESNRLVGASAADATVDHGYGHDAAGNMIQMPHLSEMGWDHAGRLLHATKQVTSGGRPNDVYFAYDTSGQRVRKVYEHGALVEETIYLGDYEVHRKRKAASSSPEFERQTLHVMDGQRRVALVETKTIDTSVPAFTPSRRQRFQLENHLGSSTLETSELGEVLSYEEYFPYGATAFSALDGGLGPRRYRYIGNERDEETGLSCQGQRYYACWLGRWTSCDPLGMVDGPSLYAYARDNPVRFTDRTGTQGAPWDDQAPSGGVGLTFDAKGVSFGALSPPGATPRCDELNPACKPVIQLDWLELASKLRFIPLKTPQPFSPKLPEGPFVFRGSDTDPLPTLNGFKARNPASNTTPVEHALGEPDSPWISVSETPEGAATFGERVYGISVPKANTQYIPPDELQGQMNEAINDGTVNPTQGKAWLDAQNNPHPASPKPGETVNPGEERPMAPPEREGVMRNEIPPEAVVAAEDIAQAARAASQAKWIARINGFGRALGVAGIVLSVAYIGISAYQSIKTGDPKPVVNALVETAGGLAGAYVGGKAGAALGFAIGGPVGAAIGTVVGGLVGAFIGSGVARKVLDWLW